MDKDSKSICFSLLIITVFFNWIFPKAGIKLGEIPLTLGIVFFILLCFFWMLKSLRNKIHVNKIMTWIMISLIYFLFRVILAFANDVTLSEIIGYAIPLIIFPFIYFILINEVNNIQKYNKIMKILVYGFFILAIYSVIQSIFGIARVDIPGLTVNLTDYLNLGDNWFMTKSNGVVESNAKIVSTYQNGNLFGVNLFIFFPVIYDYLLDKKNNKLALIALILFIITELLTLSRTCWVGIILFILFRIILSDNSTARDLIKKILIMLLSFLLIIFVLIKFPSVSERLLSTDLTSFANASGRTEGAIEFLNSVYSDGNFIINLLIGPFGFIENKGLAYEMTELAIFKISGIIGLTVWLIPIILIYISFNKKNKIERSYKIAIAVWGIISIIEGAYWLPPTALNLFIMLGLGTSYKIIVLKEGNKNEFSSNNIGISAYSSNTWWSSRKSSSEFIK